MKLNLFLFLFALFLFACEEPNVDAIINSINNIDPTKNVVTYRVTFNALWSGTTHPQDFPKKAQFSPLVIVTHNDKTKLFETGEKATEGIQSMAETGSTTTLKTELNKKIEDETVKGYEVAGDISSSPGSVDDTIKMQSTHPFISVVSMIAPSPDWFIAARGIELFTGGGLVTF